jgi:diaminopimelate decarboxylase
MVEGIMVEEIINEVGTPAYIYSKSRFIEQFPDIKSFEEERLMKIY